MLNRNPHRRSSKVSNKFSDGIGFLISPLELQLLLPTAVDELRKQAKRSPAKPEFIQLPTLGPRVMRELPPLFIIPGLASFDIVRDLANQLLYPVFAAVLPYNSMDIQEMAKHLAEVSNNDGKGNI